MQVEGREVYIDCENYYITTDNISGSMYLSFAYYCRKVAETGVKVSSMRKAKVLEIFPIHVTLRGTGINFMSCILMCVVNNIMVIIRVLTTL